MEKGKASIKDAINPTSGLTDNDNAEYLREQQLYAERLQKDYKILASNDDLRVAGVMYLNGKCRVYNKFGQTLNLTHFECQKYVDNPSMIKTGDSQRLITDRQPPPVQQPQTQPQNEPAVEPVT